MHKASLKLKYFFKKLFIFLRKQKQALQIIDNLATQDYLRNVFKDKVQFKYYVLKN